MTGRAVLLGRARWRLVLIVGALAAVALSLGGFHTSRDSFRGKLQYELNNRAFARTAMIRAAEEPARPDVLEFWRAYCDLELLNQSRYRPIEEKYDMKPQPFVVALKTRATEIAVWMFPEKALAGLADATLKYVGELRSLRDLAPAEDHAFFDYVVTQEQAQADALGHARQGRFDAGAGVLSAFVQNHADE